MKKKGVFIVVDGPSASGKDTIIKQVLKDLKKLHIKAVSIEETKEKEYNRKKILAVKDEGDKKIARVIVNERSNIYQKKVIPQLSKGIIVIANRGEPTTLGYQTLKNQLTMEDVWILHRKYNIPLPDLAVITNCSVEEAIRREEERKLSFEKDKNSMSGKFTGLSTDKKTLNKRQQIHKNYDKVKELIESKGIPLIYLKTDTMKVSEESERIIDFIKNT